MTHQAIAYRFNASRIIISRLMIRVQQPGRANDKPGSGRKRVTSQREDRHIRTIHFWNVMIMAVDK
jgi:transposase